MGGKGSGRPRITYEDTMRGIDSALYEIRDELRAANAKIDILTLRIWYYRKTVSKRR